MYWFFFAIQCAFLTFLLFLLTSPETAALLNSAPFILAAIAILAGGGAVAAMNYTSSRKQIWTDYIWEASGMVITLGLIGTLYGFIRMFLALKGVDFQELESLKAALGGVFDGMGIALYTTLAGLVAGLYLRSIGFITEAWGRNR